MPNCYTNLATIKSTGTLNIPSTNTDYDSQLLRIADDSSRMIDRYCDRYFYIWEGTRYYDGGAIRVVLDDDVQSITTGTTGLTVDTDGDGVYESAYEMSTAPVDAFLYPFNITPKTRLEANPWGKYGHFGAGIRKAIKITGVFGYGSDYPQPYYHAAGATLNADLAVADVIITVSTSAEFSAGMTLRINAEQLYVSGMPAATTTCPVVRAQNGTVAATATSGTAIQIYDYPQAITQATVIQTVRTWKRRESGYVNTIINTDMGNIQIFKGLDPDVKETVNLYRRMRIPRYF